MRASAVMESLFGHQSGDGDAGYVEAEVLGE